MAAPFPLAMVVWPTVSKRTYAVRAEDYGRREPCGQVEAAARENQLILRTSGERECETKCVLGVSRAGLLVSHDFSHRELPPLIDFRHQTCDSVLFRCCDQK
ncbi:hypothetical protein B0H67DRAFT_239635 [Lasiosphaeris hirsuta]|uniref:C2H2-type domain-containing protein n=1 Tax=Lasiosphaeris hirsuta TaxID=260670 RepID=A0AA40AGJ3_9PEZI|nr:hypothetical protein B0H67DRAFT_239635 [Lasiosphaeris hirsuta]